MPGSAKCRSARAWVGHPEAIEGREAARIAVPARAGSASEVQEPLCGCGLRWGAAERRVAQQKQDQGTAEAQREKSADRYED